MICEAMFYNLGDANRLRRYDRVGMVCLGTLKQRRDARGSPTSGHAAAARLEPDEAESAKSPPCEEAMLATGAVPGAE